MPISAVIFDMDGVLVDSEKYWSEAEEVVFGELGVDVNPEFRHITQVLTAPEVIQFWYKKAPWDGLSFEEVEQRVIQYVKYCIQRDDCATPGATSFIRKLTSEGYSLGLGTNSPYPLAETVLKKLEVEECFHAIVTADQVSKGKPDPEIYLLAAERLQIPPSQCLVIEDSYYGMEAAKAAGMQVAAYLPDLLPSTVQIPATLQADYILKSFDPPEFLVSSVPEKVFQLTAH
jgi:HAD superfamily hydrolase (TIGR01509 family)